jgi:hypothetical protein
MLAEDGAFRVYGLRYLWGTCFGHRFITAAWELLGVGRSAWHGIEFVGVSLPGGTSV